MRLRWRRRVEARVTTAAALVSLTKTRCIDGSYRGRGALVSVGWTPQANKSRSFGDVLKKPGQCLAGKVAPVTAQNMPPKVLQALGRRVDKCAACSGIHCYASVSGHYRRARKHQGSTVPKFEDLLGRDVGVRGHLVVDAVVVQDNALGQDHGGRHAAGVGPGKSAVEVVSRLALQSAAQAGCSCDRLEVGWASLPAQAYANSVIQAWCLEICYPLLPAGKLGGVTKKDRGASSAGTALQQGREFTTGSSALRKARDESEHRAPEDTTISLQKEVGRLPSGRNDGTSQV